MFLESIFNQQQGKRITNSHELAQLMYRQTRETLSGIGISKETAMQVTAVNRGVNLMADMVAMLPFKLFQILNGGNKEEARKHPEWPMLRLKPNQFQTQYSYRYMQQRALQMTGNAYAFKVKTGYTIQRLIPILPELVRVEVEDDLSKVFLVRQKDGSEKKFTSNEVWHLIHRTENGYTGIGIIDEAPEAIAIALQTQRHQAMLFGNGAKTSGILSTDSVLNPTKMQQIREAWQAVAGGNNKFGTPVLDSGLKYTQMGMTNQDAQFIELNRHQIEEIARLVGVPAMLLFHSDSTSTYASSKEFVLAFLKFSLDPWLVDWEQSYTTDLINNIGNKYYAQFIREGLERMDLLSRVTAYSGMITSRIMNPNEARAKENMNEYDGGDSFENPAITPGQTGGDTENETE